MSAEVEIDELFSTGELSNLDKHHARVLIGDLDIERVCVFICVVNICLVNTLCLLSLLMVTVLNIVFTDTGE